MPLLVNGFGVWNWGKQNAHSHLGACEHCGAVTMLSSYDTRPYITAFGPIIPLGRRRVVFHCPHCNKFRVVKMKQWLTGKAQAREEALRAVAEHATDADAVLKALQQTVAFQDANTFDEIAPRIRQAYAENAHMLQVLSEGYDFFGHPDEAIEAISTATHIEDTPERREITALFLIRERHPDDARQWLVHVLDQSREEGIPEFFNLVQCYQALGRHAKALEVIQDVHRAFPDLQKDKQWTKLQKLSEKNLASSKLVEDGLFNKNLKPVKEESARGPLIAVPSVLVAVVIAYFGWAWYLGHNREVYFVNGLDAQYEVVLDDQPFLLEPGKPTPKKLVEGTHTVAVPSLGLEPQSFTVSTDYFERPFLRRLFVVNPDQVAILVWESTEYMENPDESARYDFKLHTNKLLHRFKNIHFPFEEFPDEIEMEGSRATRRRVDILTGLGPADLPQNFSHKDHMEHYKRRFHYDPENSVYLNLLSMFVDPEALLGEIQDELTMRPVLMEVHRSYQSIREQIHPEYDIEAEYASHLAEEPENGDLVYLLGRVTRDRTESLSLFRRAAEGDPPNAYALNALAFDHLAIAQFEEAKSYVDKALALQPDNPLFQWNWSETRLALRDYPALLGKVERDRTGMATSFGDALQEVHLLTLNGTPLQDVEKRIQKYIAIEVQRGLLEGARPMVTRDLTLEHVYALGDTQRALEILSGTDKPNMVYQAALLAGDFQKASETLEAIETATKEHHFLIYMQAALAGQMELAERHLEQAAAILAETGSREEKYAASCLLGEEEPDIERLLHLGMFPGAKCVLMAALGVRFPENRSAYFDLARRLNYHVTFMHRPLKDLLGPEAAAPGTPSPDAATEQSDEGAAQPAII